MRARRDLHPARVAGLLLILAAASCKGGPLQSVEPLSELMQASFEGELVHEPDDLREVVRTELTSGTASREVTKARADDAAYALELFHRSAGYPDAEVSYEFEDGQPPRVRFVITPGPAVRLGAVRVEGVERFEPDELAALLGPVAEGRPFVAKTLGAAASRLRTAYLAKGFLSVAVEPPRVVRSSEDVAEVSFIVEEGPRHVIRSARIEGALEELEAPLNELAQAYVDQPYGPYVRFELGAAVRREHGLLGYPDCEVETEVGEEPDVDLLVRVKPGPLVRISDIKVVGNDRVPDRRVKARIALAPGDVYDSKLVSRSFNQLYTTGLFEAVRFDLVGDGPERRLEVAVTETASLQVFVEPGWGSYEGPRVRAGIDENNLFATALRGRLEGWYSELARGVELQLADPFLFGTAVTGELSFFAKDREDPSFTVDEVGTGLDFRRAWTEELSTTIGFEFSETKLSDVDVNSGSVPQSLLQSIDIGELTFALSFDTRDNVLIPRSGNLARLHTGVAVDALGSSIEAFEAGVDLTTVVSFGDSTQLAAAGRVGVIQPYGDTDEIPLQRRLFNGGENTVRSFRESKLGPVDPNNEPLGGEARTMMSIELRRRLGGNLSGALFYDLGNVELNHEDYFDFDGFRHGIGIGVRYLLPIGPLRVDAAWNPDHRSSESEFVVHFSVGLPY